MIGIEEAVEGVDHSRQPLDVRLGEVALERRRLDLVERQGGEDLPVAAERVAVGAERGAAVLADGVGQGRNGRRRLARRDFLDGEAARFRFRFLFPLGGHRESGYFHGSCRPSSFPGPLADRLRRRPRGRGADPPAGRADAAAPLRAARCRRRPRDRGVGQAREPGPDQLLQDPQRPLGRDAPVRGRAAARRRGGHARQPRARRGVRGRPPSARPSRSACRAATTPKRTKGCAASARRSSKRGGTTTSP